MSRKNPRFNASGCVDMTAFHAIRAADRELKKKRAALKRKQNKPQGKKPAPCVQGGGV